MVSIEAKIGSTYVKHAESNFCSAFNSIRSGLFSRSPGPGGRGGGLRGSDAKNQG